MTFATVIYQEQQLIRMVHTFISLTFLIAAVWLFYRSFQGYFKKLKYARTDKILSYAFIINLYLQLVFGLILMTFQDVSGNHIISNQEVTMKLASKRFWPVEHIVLMLFALFIANLGFVFANSSQTDREKYKNTVIYYAISVVLIALSLGSTWLE